jgi:hypothetical protein
MTSSHPHTWRRRARRTLACAVAVAATGAALAGGVVGDVVDNCATLLGSLSTELRYARAQPPGARTSFACPREREARAALGASRERVLRALGTPDRTGVDAAGATLWTYAFASKYGPPAPGGRGTPELRFHFDASQQVTLLDCEYTR